MTHWTTGSPEDFAYFVSVDFMTQIELTLEEEGMEKQRFAALIGVDPSRVSQLLHNPGNLQIDTMVKCTRALGKKLAVVVYSDGDTQNVNGPISGDLFRDCWKKLHQPTNGFGLENLIVTKVYPKDADAQKFYRPVQVINAPTFWKTGGASTIAIFGGRTPTTTQSGMRQPNA